MAQVGHNLYTTEAEATARAVELGCKNPEGNNYHTTVIEDVTYYVPCKDYDSYTNKAGYSLVPEGCSDCCDCTIDQLALIKMWNCTYVKLIETFLNQSYYGDRCLADTTEKLHLFNSFFWLFQTNNAPLYPLDKYKGVTYCGSKLMDTFSHTICQEVTCDMLYKFDELIGSCCVLQENEPLTYCELNSIGVWEPNYNNVGYQLNNIVKFGDKYWRSTEPNNTNSPSLSVNSGWVVCGELQIVPPITPPPGPIDAPELVVEITINNDHAYIGFGEIHLIVTGGVAPYNYQYFQVSGPVPLPCLPNCNVPDIVGVTNGEYTVTVTDSNGAIYNSPILSV